MIAGWRYAKGASIAETARKFRVSRDTVKRACRDHGDGALAARQAWFYDQWHLLTDRLLFVHEKRGGYLPVVLNLSRRIKQLEAGLRETERAMSGRGISYTPLLPEPSPASERQREEARRWDRVFGFDGDEDDPWGCTEWGLTPFQERELGW
jgi:hypothetical protein